MIAYQLRDAPGEVFLRVAADAATGKIHYLFSQRAGTRTVDADRPGLVHQDTGSSPLGLPVFQQPHQQRRFSGAKRATEDIEGNRCEGHA